MNAAPRVLILVAHKVVDDYACHVLSRLREQGYDVVVSLPSLYASLNKRVMEAQEARYDYILLVGAHDKARDVVSVRGNDNHNYGSMTIEDVLALFQRHVAADQE